ncbi:MAG: hypothetical protein IJB49_04215 [Clostridia bacterium]|nr:hypothetical protein [Clostridia bacterium]
MKIKRIIYTLSDIAAAMLFVYLLIFPEYASDSTREALDFCAGTLIPSLFIYMVLSKIVITHPFTDKLMSIAGCEAVALITGALCGAPVGAKNALSLYESGRISKRHAEYLLSFTNNTSVSFLLGFVGLGISGDMRVGIRLLFFQLIGSLCAAIIMKLVIFGKESLPKCRFAASERVGLRESLADSVQTMLVICACAVFFIVASGAVASAISLSPCAEALLRSVLEFSSGCAAAAKCGDQSFVITAFAIGGGGLSVALQVKSVTAGRLSFRPYLAGKAVTCAVTTALSVIFG